MKNVRRTLSVILAVAFSLGQAQAAEVVNKIVAVVNGEIITKYELDTGLQPYLMTMNDQQQGPQLAMLREKLLEKRIVDILILQEAEKLGLEVSAADVDNHIRQFRMENSITEDELKKKLREDGLTYEQYRTQIRDQLLRYRLMNIMVRRKVLVSDRDIRAYYESNAERYSQEGRVALGLLLLPDTPGNREIARSVASGRTEFTVAVKNHSVGPGQDSGGAIGSFAWQDLAKSWQEALEGIEPGGVTEPFTINDQIAILRLESMTRGETVPLEDVRDEIREKLIGPKFEKRFQEYIASLKNKAIIDNKL